MARLSERLSDITKGEGRELDRILDKAGLDAPLARAIIRNEDLARIMVQALKNEIERAEIERSEAPTFTTYEDVPVDYSIRPTDDFSGEFDWISDDYPRSSDWQRHETCQDLPTEGVRKQTFELVHIKKRMYTKQVLDVFEAKGLRPATLEEFICFARKHPDLQREFEVIGLGSSLQFKLPARGDTWGFRANWGYPQLGPCSRGRSLSLRCIDDWDDLRFLAVRKSAPAKPEKAEEPIAYPVTVDRSLTLAQMIEAGAYDNHAKAVGKFTEDRFPVDRTGSLKEDKELFLVPPSRDGMTTSEWKAELEANGWVLEQAPELFALGAKYPDLQRRFFIIAFGSSRCDQDGRLYSPELWLDLSDRRVEMIWCNAPRCDWHPQYRALVSRKSAPAKPEKAEEPIAYPVTVDRSLTLAQMIKAGAYDNYEEAIYQITEDRFPVNRTGTHREEKELFLVPPSREGMTATEWKAELEANGWVLEQTPEILALGAKYPYLQRKESFIIAFGSSWSDPDGCMHSPGLWCRGVQRIADARWYRPDDQFGQNRYALVSRKSP